jgi:hypothetical protein
MRLVPVKLLTGRAVLAVASGALLCACGLNGSGRSGGSGGSGDTATWTLLDGGSITSASRRVALGVTRLSCAGGETGTVLGSVVAYEPSRIVIDAKVAPLPPGVAYACPGNNSVRIEVQLAEPIGQRVLVDAACLQGRAVDPAVRVDDSGVRWRPPAH